jgi:hypothetical protein
VSDKPSGGYVRVSTTFEGANNDTVTAPVTIRVPDGAYLDPEMIAGFTQPTPGVIYEDENVTIEFITAEQYKAETGEDLDA